VLLSSSLLGTWAHVANGSSRSRLGRTWLRNTAIRPCTGPLARRCNPNGVRQRPLLSACRPWDVTPHSQHPGKSTGWRNLVEIDGLGLTPLAPRPQVRADDRYPAILFLFDLAAVVTPLFCSSSSVVRGQHNGGLALVLRGSPQVVQSWRMRSSLWRRASNVRP